MKEQLKFIALNALKMLVSFGVGFLFHKFSPNAPDGSSWLIGSMAFLILHIWDQTHQAKKNLEEHRGSLSIIAETLARDSASQTLLHVALSYAGRPLDCGETTRAWRKLCWFTQEKYVATNFINPKPFYESGDAQDVVTLQMAKIRTDPKFAIMKVLIWKDATERDSPEAREIVDLHRKDPRAQMNLRGIVHGEVDQVKELKDGLSKLGGRIDFAIFDDRVVLIWRLDQATREVTGGSVVVSEQEVLNFTSFFDSLYGKSQPVS